MLPYFTPLGPQVDSARKHVFEFIDLERNRAYIAGLRRAAEIVRTVENNWTRIDEEIAALEKELVDAGK